MLGSALLAVVFGLSAGECASLAQGPSRRSRLLGPLRAFGACALLWVLAIAVLPSLLAIGERFDGPGTPATTATGLLGCFTLWSLALFSLLLFGTNAVQIARARWRDPARPIATSVLLQCPRGARGRAGAALRALGLQPLFRERSRELPVRLRWAPESVPAAGPERWPLTVTEAELESPALRTRIARRDVVQRRRALGKRLENLLRGARRRRYERGAGFWIAPHFWLATHLTRDEDEDDGRIIGPPYHRVLPWPRAHLYEVLRDLQIDLLFLEDGVSARSARRVLALVFEHHDLSAPSLRGRAPFLASRGARLLARDRWRGDAQRAGLPEPSTRTSAGRILHVFRDRGDPGVRRDALDSDRLPAPPRFAPALR